MALQDLFVVLVPKPLCALNGANKYNAVYGRDNIFFHNLHPTESPAQRGSSLASNGHEQIQDFL